MRQALIRHQASLTAAVTQIGADAARSRGGNLELRYFVTGKMDDLLLPPVATPRRADELWRHTCFEAFISAKSDGTYYEFNFSPSTQWAVYRFSGYRTGMIAAEIPPPRIEVRTSDASFELQVSLELSGLPDLPGGTAWRLGLSAMIEETDGRKSYWALAHPPGDPDFHHSVCFAAELPAA
jgi:hypothetical protein